MKKKWNKRVSFSPLYRTMRERGVTMDDMVSKGVVSRSCREHIMRHGGKFVTEDDVLRIGVYLNCQVNEIVTFADVKR